MNKVKIAVRKVKHMNKVKIAKQLLVLARQLVSMEFDTEEAKKKYQQDHEVRPGTKLTVTKTDSPKKDKLPSPSSGSSKVKSIGTGKTLFKPIDVGKKWTVEAERMEDGSIQGYATNADSARTYVMGDDDFKDVPLHVEQILKRAIR